MTEIIKPNRRGFLIGLTSLIVAPAIVRVQNIMPVKQMIWSVRKRVYHIGHMGILFEIEKDGTPRVLPPDEAHAIYASMRGEQFYDNNGIGIARTLSRFNDGGVLSDRFYDV